MLIFRQSTWWTCAFLSKRAHQAQLPSHGITRGTEAGGTARPAATQPRGLLCASHTASATAKQQRNVRDNLNSKYLPKALRVAAEVGLEQKDSGNMGEEEGNQGTTDMKNIKRQAEGGLLKFKNVDLNW